TVAGSEKTKETADPAPTRAEVEQLRNEVERLRSLVDSLVKEREATKEGAKEVTKEANRSEPQSASKEQNNQSNSIYSTNQSQEKQEKQEPQELPGRGSTEQGLYGTVAAGGSRGRYGRSLFSENVRIGCYGSFRYEASNLDNPKQVGNLAVAKRNPNGFDIRRLVLTADVSPAERLRFYTEIEFERFGKIEIERAAVPNGGGKPGTKFISELEG